MFAPRDEHVVPVLSDGCLCGSMKQCKIYSARWGMFVNHVGEEKIIEVFNILRRRNCSDLLMAR